MNYKTSIIVLAILVSLSSCRKDHLSSGEIVTEFREVTNYDRVQLEGSLDLIIVQDPEFDIKIVAGENKIPYIKTKVVGNTLRIYETRNSVIGTNQDKIYISKSLLESISLDGSGDIDGTGILAEDIDLMIDGSGDITLDMTIQDRVYCQIQGSGDMLVTGESQDLELDLDGSGSLDARFFPVDNAYITINGSGETRVYAIELLDVQIHGSGDVYYVGNPNTISVDIQGSGGIGPL